MSELHDIGATSLPLPHDLFCDRCYRHIRRIGDPTPEQRRQKGGTCRQCLDHIELCETMERLIAALEKARRNG